MATKSFTTEFKFNQRSANGLINAIENSRKVNHTIQQPVKSINDKKSIDSIMSSFLKGK